MEISGYIMIRVLIDVSLVFGVFSSFLSHLINGEYENCMEPWWIFAFFLSIYIFGSIQRRKFIRFQHGMVRLSRQNRREWAVGDTMKERQRECKRYRYQIYSITSYYIFSIRSNWVKAKWVRKHLLRVWCFNVRAGWGFVRRRPYN